MFHSNIAMNPKTAPQYSDKYLNTIATNTNHSLPFHSVKETRVKKCQGKGVGRFAFTENDCVVYGVLPEQAIKAENDGFL